MKAILSWLTNHLLGQFCLLKQLKSYSRAFAIIFLFLSWRGQKYDHIIFVKWTDSYLSRYLFQSWLYKEVNACYSFILNLPLHFLINLNYGKLKFGMFVVCILLLCFIFHAVTHTKTFICFIRIFFIYVIITVSLF